MKNLLKAIFTQLKTLPAVQWADEDYGQIDNYQDRPPVQFPCVLVSIDRQYIHNGGNEYDVTGTITLRVAHNRLADRSGMANDSAIEQSLKKLDDVEAVKDAFTGFTAQGISGKFYLAGYQTERRADGLAVKILTFAETHEEYL